MFQSFQKFEIRLTTTVKATTKSSAHHDGEGNHKEHKDRTEELFVLYAFFAVTFFFGCGEAALGLCGEIRRRVFNSERVTL